MAVVVETNLQDLAVIAHEPSRFRIRKTHRPEPAHSGQFEPGASLIGSPGRRSGAEIRLGLRGNYNGMVVFLVSLVVLVAYLVIATDVRQAENCSLHRRLVRKSPSLPAVIRRRRFSRGVRRQIAATQNSVLGVAK